MVYQRGKLLSQEELHTLHEAGLEILETLGVKISHPEVYKRVVQAGGKPVQDGSAVLLPRDLVMRCVKQCPGSVTLADRRGGRAVLEPGGRPYYFTGNALTWTDSENKIRPITRKDYADYARVVDSLDQVFGMVGTNIADVPTKSRDVSGFKIMLENTRGHLRPCLFSAGGAKTIIEMADVILDGRPYEELPFFSFGYSIVSPLHWSFEACDIFLQTAGRKIPLTVNSEPLAGGTSPVTLAGSLAIGNAEVLSGLVINQVVEPGRPLIYNMGFAHLLDMFTAVALTGSPENSLMAGAGAELAAFYGLPSASWFGTDSLTVDGQACLEKMLTILTQACGGPNFLWGVGNTEATKQYSLEMCILDNEMLGAAERFRRGILVDDRTLAMDAIYEVGFGGDFLSHEHTLDNYREENRYVTALNRTVRDKWEAAGRPTSEDRARSIVAAVLAKPRVPFVDEATLGKLEAIESRWIASLA